MSMRIITGSTGSVHVTSNNDGEFNQSLWGDGCILLDIGEQLEATLVDNNTITIADGDIIMQGRHALIEPGTTETVSIDTGSVGNNRIDLIVARYELNSATGYESINLEVIKGTESSGAAVAPSYNTGDIRTGSSKVDFPLYEVKIEGISITQVKALATPQSALASKIKKNEDFVSSMTSLLTGTIAAGDTTITISSSLIKTSSIIDIYFKDKVLAPVSVTVNNGSIEIEIAEEETDTDIGVRVL